MKEIITIQISKYLSDALAKEIAAKQWGCAAPSWVNRVRQSLFDEVLENNDCFDVIATAPDGAVVGRLHCIKHTNDPSLWYYGDLFVIPDYRRNGIAKQMIRAAMAHLAERGASVLRCYVEPNNLPSIMLQKSAGFAEKPFLPFNNLINDGEIMYETDIPNMLTAIPATEHEAYFVRIMFAQSRDALHTEDIGYEEWKTLLAADDPDEKHFLICKGALPVAYLKLNGLQSNGKAWISMLFVSPSFRRQGVGRFAIRFAEQYVVEHGFASLSVQTDADNTAAIHCYTNCGYQIFDSGQKIKLCKLL